MTLTGAGNRWTDHVRTFAKQRNISYMCAMSDPDCSLEYQYKKDKAKGEAKGEAPKKPRGKKAKAEASAKASSAPLGDIYPEVEVQSVSTPEAVRSVLKKKAEETKERSERGKMGAEDIISAAVKRATPVSAVPQAKTKTGRPRKYASAEEAKKAKSQKTMEAAKKRKEAKKAEAPKSPEEIKSEKKAMQKEILKLRDGVEKMKKDGAPKDQINASIREYNALFRKYEDTYRKVGKGMTLMSEVKSGRGRPRKAAQVEMGYSRPNNAAFGDASIGKQFATMDAAINRPANADFGDPLSGGRRRRRGIGAFFNAIGDAARVVNPMTYLISNKKTAKAMSDLGQVTNNNILPAVVSVGKPLYDTAAVVGSTALTGNPILGKVAADSLWNRMAAPYDPRKRQTSPELKQLSEYTGNELAKYGKMAAAGGALLGMGYDMGYSAGASTIQKGIAAELRTYMPYIIRGALNNIAHSGDKYPEAGNEFVDQMHRPDEFAEDWLDAADKYYMAMKRAQETGQRMPFIPLPPDTRVAWEESKKKGKKPPPPPAKKAPPAPEQAPAFTELDFPALGKGFLLGSDPHTWTPQGLPQY